MPVDQTAAVNGSPCKQRPEASQAEGRAPSAQMSWLALRAKVATHSTGLEHAQTAKLVHHSRTCATLPLP